MTWLIVIGIVIITSIVTLPFVIKGMLNERLRRTRDYSGRIDRLRINLFAGKISLYGVRVSKTAATTNDKPFLLVPSIFVFISWKELLRKVLDVEIVINNPKVVFIAEKALSTEPKPANSPNQFSSLKTSIEKLLPFRINVDVRDGSIHYVNSRPDANFDVNATGVNITIHNFSNRTYITSCSITATCCIYSGIATINATLFPLTSNLTVDLNLELESINLVPLNSLFRNYGKIDIDRGTLDLYSEIAIENNRIKGYLKPLLKDLNFIGPADRGDNTLNKIWERIVAALYHFLENDRNDQVGTKIPIEGDLNHPDIRVGIAILGIISNAFVKALTSTLENAISPRAIWRMIQNNPKALVTKFLQKRMTQPK